MELTVLENIKKHKFIFGGGIILFLVLIIIIIIIVSPKSENEDKKGINNKIREYKENTKNKIDYMKKDEVIEKLIYNKLSKVEYKNKTNKTKLKFGTLKELEIYEEEIKKDKDKIYEEAYNNSINRLKESLEWLNPLKKGLGLNPNERVGSASISLIKNISDEDKVIYTHLSKTNELERTIKSLLNPIDYATLLQTKAGIAGLMLGSLL